MILYNFKSEAQLTDSARGWDRERRSAWLRLVVLAVLVVSLGFAESHLSVLVHANVLVSYGIVTGLALVSAQLGRGPSWLPIIFVALDALMVLALFHEHLFSPGQVLDHNLTVPALAIGFLLLTHVALRLQPRMVVLFSSLVVVGWFSLLVAAVAAHLGDYGHGFGLTELVTEVALAGSFLFAALVCWLLTQDHNRLLESAVANERRRANLSRFFSPAVLSELQAEDGLPSLIRRHVCVMFVDLRGFTRLSEAVPPEDIAAMLVEYREIVTNAVFEHGGMVDKFMGDGIMAAFGQPKAKAGDADRALRCAIYLADALADWRLTRRRAGRSAPPAGIGLHAGTAIGGVLKSGSQDEFTLFGDTVNVAERLERLCKELDASLVVSEQAMTEATGLFSTVGEWQTLENVILQGRVGKMRVAYRSAEASAGR